jgi:hypothetical protein
LQSNLLVTCPDGSTRGSLINFEHCRKRRIQLLTPIHKWFDFRLPLHRIDSSRSLFFDCNRRDLEIFARQPRLKLAGNLDVNSLFILFDGDLLNQFVDRRFQTQKM